MALAGALAARSMQGGSAGTRGRTDSSSPLAQAVTLFADGWQGGEIPGVFNDEEELERDLTKLKQIADRIWRCGYSALHPSSATLGTVSRESCSSIPQTVSARASKGGQQLQWFHQHAVRRGSAAGQTLGSLRG